jgi:hypothetical protein
MRTFHCLGTGRMKRIANFGLSPGNRGKPTLSRRKSDTSSSPKICFPIHCIAGIHAGAGHTRRNFSAEGDQKPHQVPRDLLDEYRDFLEDDQP